MTAVTSGLSPIPKHKVRGTWFLRLPYFVVGWAALNRGHWLIYEPPEQIASVDARWWVVPFGIAFTLVGLINIFWHLSAPWRSRTGTPIVALFTSLVYGGYAIAIIIALGLTEVRAVVFDLFALALVILFSFREQQEQTGLS